MLGEADVVVIMSLGPYLGDEFGSFQSRRQSLGQKNVARRPEEVTRKVEFGRKLEMAHFSKVCHLRLGGPSSPDAEVWLPNATRDDSRNAGRDFVLCSANHSESAS
jgi:hypothetical protein